MTQKNLNKIVEATLKSCKETLIRKGDEYVTTNDALANFKKSAALQGVTPKQALLGYMSKHTISIATMIGEDGDFPAEKWDEKIGDSINYLILLRAIVAEEAANENIS